MKTDDKQKDRQIDRQIDRYTYTHLKYTYIPTYIDINTSNKNKYNKFVSKLAVNVFKKKSRDNFLIVVHEIVQLDEIA